LKGGVPSAFRRRAALLAAVPLLAAACAGPGRWSRAHLDGAVLTPSIPKPDFTLTDTRGRPWDFRAATRGRIALLYFGYTHCPDECPLQMANVAAALRRLEPALARQVAVVFVTTDSARDSLPRLRSWLDGFDSSFVGVTGSLARVDTIEARMRILVVSRPEPDSAGGYAMTHSALVLAFTRDDSAHVAFPPGVTPDGWVATLRRLVEVGPPPPGLAPGPLPARPATN
jgi:protein SCO1